VCGIIINGGDFVKAMRKDVVEELEKTKKKKIVGKWLKDRKKSKGKEKKNESRNDSIK
jgi:hypothetical protein